MNWLYLSNRVLLVAAFAGGLAFITIYWLSSRWWKSDIGRNLMAFVISETLLLGLAITVWLVGDFPGRIAIGLAAFAMFTVASWWRVTVLVRALLKRHRERETH